MVATRRGQATAAQIRTTGEKPQKATVRAKSSAKQQREDEPIEAARVSLKQAAPGLPQISPKKTRSGRQRSVVAIVEQEEGQEANRAHEPLVAAPTAKALERRATRRKQPTAESDVASEAAREMSPVKVRMTRRRAAAIQEDPVLTKPAKRNGRTRKPLTAKQEENASTPNLTASSSSSKPATLASPVRSASPAKQPTIQTPRLSVYTSPTQTSEGRTAHQVVEEAIEKFSIDGLLLTSPRPSTAVESNPARDLMNELVSAQIICENPATEDASLEEGFEPPKAAAEDQTIPQQKAVETKAIDCSNAAVESIEDALEADTCDRSMPLASAADEVFATLDGMALGHKATPSPFKMPAMPIKLAALNHGLRDSPIKLRASSAKYLASPLKTVSKPVHSRLSPPGLQASPTPWQASPMSTPVATMMATPVPLTSMRQTTTRMPVSALQSCTASQVGSSSARKLAASPIKATSILSTLSATPIRVSTSPIRPSPSPSKANAILAEIPASPAKIPTTPVPHYASPTKARTAAAKALMSPNKALATSIARTASRRTPAKSAVKAETAAMVDATTPTLPAQAQILTTSGGSQIHLQATSPHALLALPSTPLQRASASPSKSITPLVLSTEHDASTPVQALTEIEDTQMTEPESPGSAEDGSVELGMTEGDLAPTLLLDVPDATTSNVPSTLVDAQKARVSAVTARQSAVELESSSEEEDCDAEIAAFVQELIRAATMVKREHTVVTAGAKMLMGDNTSAACEAHLAVFTDVVESMADDDVAETQDPQSEKRDETAVIGDVILDLIQDHAIAETVASQAPVASDLLVEEQVDVSSSQDNLFTAGEASAATMHIAESHSVITTLAEETDFSLEIPSATPFAETGPAAAPEVASEHVVAPEFSGGEDITEAAVESTGKDIVADAVAQQEAIDDIMHEASENDQDRLVSETGVEESRVVSEVEHELPVLAVPGLKVKADRESSEAPDALEEPTPAVRQDTDLGSSDDAFLSAPQSPALNATSISRPVVQELPVLQMETLGDAILVTEEEEIQVVSELATLAMSEVQQAPHMSEAHASANMCIDLQEQAGLLAEEISETARESQKLADTAEQAALPGLLILSENTDAAASDLILNATELEEPIVAQLSSDPLEAAVEELIEEMTKPEPQQTASVSAFIDNEVDTLVVAAASIPQLASSPAKTPVKRAASSPIKMRAPSSTRRLRSSPLKPFDSGSPKRVLSLKAPNDPDTQENSRLSIGSALELSFISAKDTSLNLDFSPVKLNVSDEFYVPGAIIAMDVARLDSQVVVTSPVFLVSITPPRSAIGQNQATRSPAIADCASVEVQTSPTCNLKRSLAVAEEAEDVRSSPPKKEKKSTRRQSRRQSYLTATKAAVREREVEFAQRQAQKDVADEILVAEAERDAGLAASLLVEMPGSVERRRSRRLSSLASKSPLSKPELKLVTDESFSPVVLDNSKQLSLQRSAIKIQSCFRGWRERKQLSEMREQEQMRTAELDSNQALEAGDVTIEDPPSDGEVLGSTENGPSSLVSSLEAQADVFSAESHSSVQQEAAPETKKGSDIDDMFSDFLKSWQTKKSQKAKEPVPVPVAASPTKQAGTPRRTIAGVLSPQKSMHKSIAVELPSSAQKAKQRSLRSQLPAPKSLLPVITSDLVERSKLRAPQPRRGIPVPVKPTAQLASPAKAGEQDRKRKEAPETELVGPRLKRSRAVSTSALAAPLRSRSPIVVSGTRSAPTTPKKLLHLTPAEVTKTTRDFTSQNRLYRCDFERVVVHKDIPRPPSPPPKQQAKMAQASRVRRRKLTKEKGYTFGAGDDETYAPRLVTPTRKAIKWSETLEIDLLTLPKTSPTRAAMLAGDVNSCISQLALDDFGNVEGAMPLTPVIGPAPKVVVKKILYKGEVDD